MTRPPTPVRTRPTSNSFKYNTFHTLGFVPPATPIFSTTSPLLGKQPGVYPQKRISGEALRPANANLSTANSNAESQPEICQPPLHHKHSPPVAPHPLSMYIEPRPHLQFSARRLGP